LDQVIHPWVDGCARLSTAVVMWLALIKPGYGLPCFQDRERHYQTIRHSKTHVFYYFDCLP